MEPKPDFLPLLLVFLLAFLIPPLLSRVRWMPSVIGQILAGLLIGRSGLRLIQVDFTLDFLAEVGLAFLMFLSGLEIDFGLLFAGGGRGFRRFKALISGGAYYALSLGMAVGLSFLLIRSGMSGDPWMIALILSTTSLGIVLPVLKERNLSPTPFGQTVLLIALLADFLAMFFITVYVTLRSTGLTLDILLVGVLFIMALFAYRLGHVRLRRIAKKQIFDGLAQPSPQARVHGAVALLMAFIVLSHFLGTEMILGAFLAGAVLSLLTRSGYEMMRHRLEGIGFGFFVPIFFITVGIRFDLPALLRNTQALTFAAVLLAAAFLIKIVPSLLLRLSFGWRETIASGVLLSANLSLIVAAAGIGLRLGIIDETGHAAFILIAVATSTLAPLGFNLILPCSPRRTDKVICLYGISSLGLKVARELKCHEERVLFFETDPAQAKNAAEAGFEATVTADLTAELEKLAPESVKAVLVLTSDDSRNVEVGRDLAARGYGRVIALINRPSQTHEPKIPGVLTFAPSLYQGTLLSVLARNPDLFSLLTRESDEDQGAREIYLVNPRFAGLRVRELGLGGGFLVLSVHRENHIIVPNGNTVLEIGDTLTVLGNREELAVLAERFEWR